MGGRTVALVLRRGAGLTGFSGRAVAVFFLHAQLRFPPSRRLQTCPCSTGRSGGRAEQFASIGTALPYIASGKIKALGLTSANRATALPTVPTVAEQGLSGYEVTMWFAVVGPSKLPLEVAARLVGALTDTLADAAVQTAIKRQGYEPTPSTPQQLHNRIQTDLAKWNKVVRDRKLTFE